MNDNIQANYAEMHGIATKVASSAEDYSRGVEDIYKIIEDLETNWQGVDNLSYVNTAKSYQEDLLALGKALDNYSKFLTASADAIKGTQDDIADAASRM